MFVLSACQAARGTTPSVMVEKETAGFQNTCIAVSAPSTKIEVEGTMIFLDHSGQSIVMSGEHQEKIPEEYNNNGNYDQSVSPGRNLLLYRKVEPQNHPSASLVVAESNGHIVYQMSEDQEDQVEWLPGIDWLSETYIRYPVKNKEDQQMRLFALRVPTGEIQELRTSFPDMADGGSIEWGIDTWAISYGVKKGVNVIYDPSRTLAVYPKVQNDDSKEGQHVYLASLYDIQNDKELATIQLSGSYDPKWSPDGHYFTIVGGDPITQSRDIYLIPRSGDQFTALTGLTEQYPRGTIGTYSWSPDGQRIAFWYKEVEQEGGENRFTLMLYDLAGRKTINLCIRGNSVSAPLEFNSSFELRGKPIWSPDGTKLLVTQYDPATSDAIDLLIDLKQGAAYQIATNLEPAGWMR